MARLREIKEHRHYETIRKSVELRHDLRVAILVCVIAAVILAFAYGTNGVSSLQAKSAVTVLICLLVLIPYCLYRIYRVVIPFFYMDSYSFTEVLLDKPHHQGKGSMYFTVTIRDRMGRELEVDTHAVFEQYWEPVFEDYINQKALIAYNEKTETVLVIKKIS